jgi:hypothetical protein
VHPRVVRQTEPAEAPVLDEVAVLRIEPRDEIREAIEVLVYVAVDHAVPSFALTR